MRLVYTIFFIISTTYIVGGGIATTSKAKLCAILRGAIFQHQVLPVDVRIEVGVKSVLNNGELLVGIQWRLITGQASLVSQASIVVGVSIVGQFTRGVIAIVYLTVYPHLSFRTLLSGNDNHTVSTTLAVDGGGRCVFQH